MPFTRVILGLLPLLLLASTGGAATISITAVDGENITYDLTNVFGTSDWAYWDQTASSLTAPVVPGNEKFEVSLIGSISAFNGGNVRGTTNATKPPYDFSFTDGTTTASGTVSNIIGLFNSTLGTAGVGRGVELNVTAPSADPFTIYLWGTAFGATGTLTATAGAASDSNSSLVHTATRTPGKLYTIAVTPDSAGQAVNLRMVMTAASDTASGNVEISAVAVVVPEPSTAAVLALGTMTLALSRRRARR